MATLFVDDNFVINLNNLIAFKFEKVLTENEGKYIIKGLTPAGNYIDLIEYIWHSKKEEQLAYSKSQKMFSKIVSNCNTLSCESLKILY